MHWIILPLARFADFGGRSRRTEFWAFAALLLLGQLLATYVDRAIAQGPVIGGMGAVTLVVNLALLVPGIAVTLRRLHDIGRTGALALLFGVPYLAWMIWPGNVIVSFALLAGVVVLLVLTVQPGQTGPNAYGEDPKPAGAPDSAEAVAESKDAV